MKIVIIGGGPAGIFAAISAKTINPNNEIIVFEKTSKILTKVKISGGGRCNVTNACSEIDEFSRFYPRGQKFLKKAFYEFNAKNTIEWFEKRGVKLKTEPDNRMFPVTDNSATIIQCLLQELRHLNITVNNGINIDAIIKKNELFYIKTNEAELISDKVIIASGGSKKEIPGEKPNWLTTLGHTIMNPVPSLFSFNISEPRLHELTGLSVSHALVKVQGRKLIAEGPLLITHWGLSGPAILKLSSFGARILADSAYKFKLNVNWSGISSEDDLREKLTNFINENNTKMTSTINPFSFPGRLWEYLLFRANLDMERKWQSIGKKELGRLIHILVNDEYTVEGKTNFKEEFVTCGGISLDEINPSTMESKLVKGLYFAGEVIDVDGLTGGFNFQNAWTTGFIAGKSATNNQIQGIFSILQNVSNGNTLALPS